MSYAKLAIYSSNLNKECIREWTIVSEEEIKKAKIKVSEKGKITEVHGFKTSDYLFDGCLVRVNYSVENTMDDAWDIKLFSPNSKNLNGLIKKLGLSPQKKT